MDEGEFVIKLRVPGWCNRFALQVNGERQEIQPNGQGDLVLSRRWAANEFIDLMMEMPIRVIVDRIGNLGHVALVRGPLVYAADRAYLPDDRVLDEITLQLDPDDATQGITLITDDQSGYVHCIVPAVLARGGTKADVTMSWWLAQSPVRRHA